MQSRSPATLTGRDPSAACHSRLSLVVAVQLLLVGCQLVEAGRCLHEAVISERSRAAVKGNILALHTKLIL